MVSLGLLESLQPTFYPTEAALRGARPVHYGIVFGIVGLSKVIFSPIAAIVAVKLGIKECLCAAAIAEAVCGLSFSFLSYSHDITYFIGLSCFIRFMEGFAGSFRRACAIGLLIQMYPKKV